jgi:O-acetylserine/cysteine efflux transporter
MIALAPRDLALLVAVTLIWGLNLVVSKIGVEHIPPMLFTLLRFSIAAVLLAPWLRLHPGHMSAIVVAALLSGGIHVALLFAGLALAENVSSVAIASQLGTPFTTLLSVALLGEVVRWRRWSGILLAFAGVVIMSFDPQVVDRWASLGLVVASAFVSSLGLIAIKKLGSFRPLELQAWIAWTSVPVLLVITAILERDRIPPLASVPPEAWAALAFAAVVSSVLAQAGFYRLLRRYPVTSVAPVITLSPLFSVAFGVLLLEDQLTPRIIVGGACTLAGVFIITLRERRISDTST